MNAPCYCDDGLGLAHYHPSQNGRVAPQAPPRNRLAEAFIRGFEAGAERPNDAGDGDAMYQAFREWADA